MLTKLGMDEVLSGFLQVKMFSARCAKGWIYGVTEIGHEEATILTNVFKLEVKRIRVIKMHVGRIVILVPF